MVRVHLSDIMTIRYTTAADMLVRSLRSSHPGLAKLQVHTSDTQYSTAEGMLVSLLRSITERGTATGTH